MLTRQIETSSSRIHISDRYVKCIGEFVNFFAHQFQTLNLNFKMMCYAKTSLRSQSCVGSEFAQKNLTAHAVKDFKYLQIQNDADKITRKLNESSKMSSNKEQL